MIVEDTDVVKAISLLEESIDKKALEKNLKLDFNNADVYAYFEDKDELNKLTKKYSNDFGIEFDLAKKALRCLKNIDKKNHNFIKVMIGKVNEKELFENMNLGCYSPGDLSEVLNVLTEFSFASNDDVFKIGPKRAKKLK